MVTSTMVEAPLVETSPPVRSSAERLRQGMAATKVSFTWFGVRKSLSPEQTRQAADQFDAAATFVSATKKLLDTQHARFRAVTAVRGRIGQYWRSLTLPYPEPGLRLIRQADLATFDQQLTHFRDELAAAVDDLDADYALLRQAARERLGQLFDPVDYPATLAGEFAVSWEYPAVEPPGYLLQLNPQLYAQECQRVQQRFAEAVTLAEQAFTEELAKLVGHLTERLSGQDDGRPKVFRDSAVAHLGEFFDRFRRLNIGSSPQLDDLVQQARRILDGVGPQQLRDDVPLRQQVATQLAGVQAVLDGLLVDRPRRSIVRPVREASA